MARRRKGRPSLRKLFDVLKLVIVVAFAVVVLRALGYDVKFPDIGIPQIETGSVKIIDGDTIRAKGASIRLHGIDAPEHDQTCRDSRQREYSCGREAGNVLRRIVGAGDVSCLQRDKDRYGRAVSVCRIGQTDINAEMVRQGWAVAFEKYSRDYEALEAEAKRARRGLWAGTFELPETYRARQRAVRGSLGPDQMWDED